MKLQQVIDLAIGGELKGLAVKNDTAAIVGFINLGMIELYKRFPLSVKEHVITLVDGVEIYTLPEDLMWIVTAYEEVTDGVGGVSEVPINEEDNPLSMNTISYNQVQIPVMINGAYISIIYASAPAMYSIVGTNFYVDGVLTADPSLALPVQMIEALLHYVGYRAHNAITGEINAEHTTHYTRFEASCARIEGAGMLTSDDINMDSRLSSRGFV